MLAWALERFLAATRDIRGPNKSMVRLTNNLSSVYWNLLKNQYFVSSFRSRDENSSRRLIPFSHRSEFQLGRYSRRLVRGCRHGGSDAQRFVLPLENHSARSADQSPRDRSVLRADLVEAFLFTGLPRFVMAFSWHWMHREIDVCKETHGFANRPRPSGCGDDTAR